MAMRPVLDAYLVHYNQRRPHQGRGMNSRTPVRAFTDGLPKITSRKETKPANGSDAKHAA
jgi:hypothetical protein